MTKPDRLWVFVGTHTNDPAAGIHILSLDSGSGQLQEEGLVADVGNPFFLATDSAHTHLYAANAVDQALGKAGGGVCAFALDRQRGALTPLNQQRAHGQVPCYVSLTATGSHVLVGNYGDGTLAMLPLAADGSLQAASHTVQHTGSSVDPGRQEGPHVHSIVPGPEGRWAFAADLGTDCINVYCIDAGNGRLVPHPEQPAVTTSPGAGPRHLTFHPNGHFAYLINELDNTVVTFQYDAIAGRLEPLQTLPALPAGYGETSYCADIQVHPSGRFVYGTNRGHDSIAVFGVDAGSGCLTLIGHQTSEGHFPWNLEIDPTGNWLLVANQGGDSVVLFALDLQSGMPQPTGQRVSVAKAVCVLAVPSP